jgi:hypothetical protein
MIISRLENCIATSISNCMRDYIHLFLDELLIRRNDKGEDSRPWLLNLREHQVQQQQQTPCRRQRQTTILVRAVSLPWLAKCHSTDTTTNTAALRACIFIQKCCKMTEEIVC